MNSRTGKLLRKVLPLLEAVLPVIVRELEQFIEDLSRRATSAIEKDRPKPSGRINIDKVIDEAYESRSDR